MSIAQFLPENLSLVAALALLGVSFFASMLTAAISLGGGVLMLSVLALFFPPAILVPLHGAIQASSNAGRAVIQRAHIQWNMVLWISLGAVLGAAVGIQFAALLPQSVFQLVIGLFILVMIWLPRPQVEGHGPVASFIGGAVLSFVGVIVGVVGPLVMTFIRSINDRRQLVATHATIMTFLTGAKVGAFIIYGFAFAAYLPFILGMMAAGFAGTLVGSRLLHRLPEAVFRIGVKLVISVLALDLLRRALFG